MKKSIVLSIAVCLAALPALFCAGCGGVDYPEESTGGVNEFLGLLNGKFPDNPSGVKVKDSTGASVALTWRPASKANGYRVYRGVAEATGGSYYDGTSWVHGYYRCSNYDSNASSYGDDYKRELAAVVSDTSYIDTALTQGTAYCYGVSAYNAYGETRQSIIQAATEGVPETPENVKAEAMSFSGIVVTWSAVPGAKEYKVYRSSISSRAGYDSVGITSKNTYTDTGLAPGATYYYRISAHNGTGNSGLSAYASVATKFDNKSGSFVDARDSTAYKTVVIGEYRWMAENLNYAAEDSWCYAGVANNCKTFGRLYGWETAKAVCPAGWKLPTENDWGDLRAAAEVYSGSGYGAKMLKSSRYWTEYEYNSSYYAGTDDFEFAALPGGSRDASFGGIGTYGYWWASDTSSSGYPYAAYMSYNNNYVSTSTFYKSRGHSVRCVQGAAAK